MAITRSQIARQLLAEGGAPRKGFADGYSVQDDMTDYGANVGREASPGGGFEGGDSDPTTGATFPNLNKVTPKDVFKTSADNPMLQRSAFERMMLQMIPGIGGAINLGEMNAFNFPQFRYSNTGGMDNQFNTTDADNNKIVKPMMPMVPKLPTDIEPEESDYQEFVQRFSLPERFRLNAGGSPGNTTSQRVLPRADGRRPGYYGSDAGFGDDDYKDESASFDAGSGSGGSDADFAAARDAIMGPSTYTDDRGNTIDVSSLQKQGYGRLNIADLLGPLSQKYGIGVNTPSIDVLGPLGNIDTDKEQKGKEGKEIGLDFIFTPNAPKAIKEFTGTAPLNELGGLTRQEYQQQLLNNMADGGPIRQAYGLGSIVKKVTGAVKKVVKSDVGKAALAGAAIYGLGGGGNPFTKLGRSGFSFGNLPFVGGLFTAPGNPAQQLAMGSPFSRFLGTTAGKATLGIGASTVAAGLLTPKQEAEADSLSSKIADRTGLDIEGIRKEVQTAYANNDTESLRTKYPFLITESAAAKADGGRIGFDDGGTPQEMFPDNIDDIGPKRSAPKLRKMPELKGDEVEPSGIMMVSNMENDNILENLFEKYLDMGLSPEDAAIKAREEFDRMSKAEEPDRMMAAIGGMMNPNDEMLNLGGNEMDLRGGGFVPLGEYEKKDDVPARLSKNEFVFTADAVKAAGGGSVDRGADLMYKTMKQLENKVA